MALNILFGPPINPDILSNFFSLSGKHFVCGGSTAQCVAKFLKVNVVLSLHYENPDVPPISKIEGVDLVTEGIITMNMVLKMFHENAPVSDAQDGASLIYKELRNSSEINFFLGKENSENKQFIQLKSKKEIVSSLTSILQNLGKNVVAKEV